MPLAGASRGRDDRTGQEYVTEGRTIALLRFASEGVSERRLHALLFARDDVFWTRFREKCGLARRGSSSLGPHLRRGVGLACPIRGGREVFLGEHTRGERTRH